MKEVELFTDGACSGNPGPGGWGAILRFGGREKELSGGEPQTTNNRMELTAAIEGLAALKDYPRTALLLTFLLRLSLHDPLLIPFREYGGSIRLGVREKHQKTVFSRRRA